MDDIISISLTLLGREEPNFLRTGKAPPPLDSGIGYELCRFHGLAVQWRTSYPLLNLLGSRERPYSVYVIYKLSGDWKSPPNSGMG